MSLRGTLNVESRYNRGGQITSAPFTATVTPAVDWLTVSANTAYTGIDYAAEKNTTRAERSATIVITQTDNCSITSAITVTQTAAFMGFTIMTDADVTINGTAISPVNEIITGDYPITALSAKNSSRTKFKIYDVVTSGTTSLRECFENNYNLTDTDFASIDTTNVTDFYGMFYGCRSLPTLNINNWNMGKATNLQYMFRQCSSLNDLSLNEWDTNKITSTNHTFSQCSGLTALYVSDWNTSGVTDMQYTFDGCSSVTDFNVPDWNTSRVTDMKYMFNGCRSVPEFNISEWDTSNVTNMSYMFCGCSSMVFDEDTTPFFLRSWDTSKVQNFSHMFDGCTAFSDLDISYLNVSAATNVSYIFNGCENIHALILSDSGQWDTANATNMAGVFCNCESLTEIYFGDNFTTSAATDTSYMFCNCKNLSTFPTFDTSNVANFSYMFAGCELFVSAKSISVTESAVSLVGLFLGTHAQTLNVEDFITTNVTNTSYMFSDCPYLQNITFGEQFDTSNVTSMVSMFDGCSSLLTLELPHNFTTESVKHFDNMFRNCSGLTELDLSYFSTESVDNSTERMNMFDGCSSITSFTVDAEFFSGYSPLYDFKGLTNWTNTTELTHLVEVLPTDLLGHDLILSDASFNAIGYENREIAGSKGWTIYNTMKT